MYVLCTIVCMYVHRYMSIIHVRARTIKCKHVCIDKCTLVYIKDRMQGERRTLSRLNGLPLKCRPCWCQWSYRKAISPASDKSLQRGDYIQIHHQHITGVCACAAAASTSSDKGDKCGLVLVPSTPSERESARESTKYYMAAFKSRPTDEVQIKEVKWQ